MPFVADVLIDDCYFHDNKEALMNAIKYLSVGDMTSETGVARAIHN